MNRRQDAIRKVSNVFFCLHSVTWPIAIACLVLPATHQSLRWMIGFVVLTQTFLMATRSLMESVWFEDYRHFQTARWKSDPAKFYLHIVIADVRRALIMLLAYRFASLKLWWIFLFLLCLCGVAASMFSFLDFRAHPEKYERMKSSSESPSTKRIARFGEFLSFAHPGIWLYAWRAWIF